jgi:predicted permease
MPVAILPIILIVAIGFLVESRRPLDVRALSTITIYVTLPALIFTSLLTTELTLGEAAPLIAVVLVLTGALWLLGKGICRLRRLDREEESFLLLSTLFMNAGNMGMPIALYAFGERGLDLAVLWVLVINSLMNTVAVYYASRHQGGGRQALRTVLGLPTIYAAAAALLMRGLHLGLPPFLLEPLKLLGRSTIPLAQVLLGVQLAKARAQVSLHLPGVLLPNLIRLVLSPLLAFGLVGLFGLHGTTAKVAVLLAAMPTAVNIAIYTTEFSLQPRRIATAVFTSTLASFATLSVLLTMLAAWGKAG